MRTFFNIFLIILLLAVTVLFNFGLVDLRIDEINYLLGHVVEEEEMAKTLGIVAKYELIKQRMLYGEESISNYEMEAKIQALTSGETYTEQKKTVLQSELYRIPVLAVVNSIRFLMGKPVVNAKEDNKIYKILEIGYFWERNRKYSEAINIYDDVLNNPDLPGDLHAAVMVHAAFCHSMLSEYDAAKKIYENVIKLYPTTEAGILSWKLLDFIESIEKDRSKVEQRGLGELETAKQYYLLMDYRNAIKYYSLYLSHKPDPAFVPEAHFYKGRSHEEVGETDEAIDEYNTVIRMDASQRWAKQANRRILMLSTFYESKKQIGVEARKRLDAYQDMLFADKVGKYSGLVSESSLRSELMQQVVAKSPKKDASTDSLLSFINSIGNLDLSGEQDRQKQEEMEKLKQQLISSGKITESQLKEIERKNTLAQNAFRAPTAIKKVIDENVREMQYIYNKKLRLGDKLAGKMLIKMEIKPDGTVGSASIVQSDIGEKDFEQQVIARILQWRFKPVPDSLGDLTVNYPFEFTKEE